MGTTASFGEYNPIAPCPVGTHVARCVRLIDLGMQSGRFGVKHEVLLAWEFPKALITAEGKFKGEPYMLSQRYNLTMGEGSNLRRDVESWRGKAFRDSQENFEIKDMLGQPCTVIVMHEPKKDGTGVTAKIKGIMPLATGEECPPAVSDILYYDQDNPDASVLEKLPGWVRDLANAGNVTIPPNEADKYQPEEDIPF